MKNMQTPYRVALQEFEIDYWSRLLEECRGSVSEAARRAGCNRTYLHGKLRDLGVSNPCRPNTGKREGNWGSLTH